MKKLFMVLAATVICGACVFTSCKKEDNLKLKIIGKWMQAEIDGKPALTNDKSVTTFLSASKATVSTSRSEHSSEAVMWNNYREYSVSIDGNKITLTSQVNEHITLVNEYVVKSINGNEMVCNFRHVTIRNGQPIERDWQVIRYVKVNVDYTAAILGLWECQEVTGIETYNNANAGLEFFADGTYNYWRKNAAGEWQTVPNREFQYYFVDGTLMATRWKNVGEDELREWWEIASIDGNQMQWTALRQNADGTTVQQGMKWVKVN